MKIQPLSSLLWSAVDIVLPPRCPVSGDIVDRQGMVSPAIWAGLQFIAHPQCDTCGTPFEFGMEEGGKCLSCLENPPVFERARAALRYNDASRGLILGFKHGDKTYAVATFVPLLRQSGREILPQADILVPVPLHPYRLIRRRYNQSAIIAQGLSDATNIKYLPMALRRIRATPTQGHLNFEQRKKNVKMAFAVHPSYADEIKGKRVVLIDDVFTTGATVSECTKVLLKSGALRVDVLTVARVVRGQ